MADEDEYDADGVDNPDTVVTDHPTFRRSLGLFWLYTSLRFGLFGLLWVVLYLVGVSLLLSAAIAVVLSIPLSWVLLARPRRALAANIEARVNAHTERRAEFDARLDGDLDQCDSTDELDYDRDLDRTRSYDDDLHDSVDLNGFGGRPRIPQDHLEDGRER